MMIDKKIKQLKKDVYDANLELVKKGLVIFTFGNVSGINRDSGIVAIKPSGVDYDRITEEDIVLVAIDSGKVMESNLNPSSDIKTHLILYRSFEKIGGVAHTHSRYATAFAQANMPVECMGTTHADYFHGSVPCTEVISDNSLKKDYEKETGTLIVETFRRNNINYNEIKACLVASHGPFAWADNAMEAVIISRILEELAFQNFITKILNPDIKPIKQLLLDKHYLRKHGASAYYGQKIKKI